MQTDLSVEELDFDGTQQSEENVAAFVHGAPKQKPQAVGANTPADIRVDGIAPRAASRFQTDSDGSTSAYDAPTRALNFDSTIETSPAQNVQAVAASLFDALAALPEATTTASRPEPDMVDYKTTGFDPWVPLIPPRAPVDEVWAGLERSVQAAAAVSSWTKGTSGTTPVSTLPHALIPFHTIGCAVHNSVHTAGSAGLGHLSRCVLPSLPPDAPPTSAGTRDAAAPSIQQQVVACAIHAPPSSSAWCAGLDAASLLPLLTGVAFVLNLAVLPGLPALNDACSAIEQRKRMSQGAAAWGGQDLGTLYKATGALRLAAGVGLQSGAGGVDSLQAAASHALTIVAHITSHTSCCLPLPVVLAAARVPALGTAVRGVLGSCWVGDVRDASAAPWTAPAQSSSERSDARGLPSHVLVPGPSGVQCSPLLLAVAAAAGITPPPGMAQGTAYKAVLACLDGMTKATLAHGDLMRACAGSQSTARPWDPPAPPSGRSPLPPLSKIFTPPLELMHTISPLLYRQLAEWGALPDPPSMQPADCVSLTTAGAASPKSRRRGLKGMFAKSPRRVTHLSAHGSGRLVSPQLLSAFSGDDGGGTLGDLLRGGSHPANVPPSALAQLARQEGEGQGPVKEAWAALLASVGQSHSPWAQPRWGGGAVQLEAGMSNCTVQGLGKEDAAWLRQAQQQGLQACFVPGDDPPAPSSAAYRVTMARPVAGEAQQQEAVASFKLQLDAALPVSSGTSHMWLRLKQSPLLSLSPERGVWEPATSTLHAQAQDKGSVQEAQVLGWFLAAGLLNRASVGAAISPQLTAAITQPTAGGGGDSKGVLLDAALLALRYGGHGMVQQLQQLLQMQAADTAGFAEIQGYRGQALRSTGSAMCCAAAGPGTAGGGNSPPHTGVAKGSHSAGAAASPAASGTRGSGGGCCSCGWGGSVDTPSVAQIKPHATDSDVVSSLRDSKSMDDTVHPVSGRSEAFAAQAALSTGSPDRSQLAVGLVWRTMLDAVWGGLDVDSVAGAGAVAVAVAPPLLTALRCGARTCLGSTGLRVLHSYGIHAEALAEALGGVDGVCMAGPSNQGVGIGAMGSTAGTGDYGAGPMGTASLRIPEVFRVVYDTDLRGKRNGPLREALWSIVHQWPRSRQLDFLHFVTGSKVLPANGAEALRVELPHVPLGIQEQVAMLTLLPTAHTCTNSLELPSLWTALQAVGSVREAAGRGDLAAAQQWRSIVQSLPGVLRSTPWAQGQPADLQGVLRDMLERSLLTAITAGGGSYGLDRKVSPAQTGGSTITGSSASASPAAGGGAAGGRAGERSTSAAGDMSSDDDEEILAAARNRGGCTAVKASSTGGAAPPSPARGASVPKAAAGDVITLQW